MMDNLPIFHLARLALEADTAHGIHSGRGDNLHDVLLVRDANGLPAIPGTSLAGVLRHHYAARHGDAAANFLFGTVEGAARVSRLSVDWGLVHDATNRPHETLLDPATIKNDELLDFLQQEKPLIRQRVRLNHKGAAEAAGKFDTTLIPAGTRYTHWLGYWGDDSAESRQAWKQLIDLLAEGRLYLGHATHSGNGRFCVQQLQTARWDLRSPTEREAYAKRPRLRHEQHGMQAQALGNTIDITATLPLRAEAGWRIGGGEYSLGNHEKEPDLVPQHELRIQWNGDKASLGQQLHLLPGSAVKGALRHRVAFHWRRLAGQWADATQAPIEECPAINALFGSSSGDSGTAGLLRIDDLHLAQERPHVLMHNRIDRFTGGVIHGALFSEEVLWQSAFTLTVHVEPRTSVTVDVSTRQALQLALEDLARGDLALGASGSRGLGAFATTGDIAWSDDGAWIAATEHAANGETA